MVELYQSLVPLEKYLSQGTISTIQYGLQCAEAFFPLLTGILLIILCFHLSTSSYQLVNMAVPSKEIEKIARVLGYISQYLIMNFWLYYFIIRTIVFGNFYISQSFSMGWHWLSPNYYLVYFFSLLTISDVIFAPIHYRRAKRRQLEAYLERSEKMLTKNDKS